MKKLATILNQFINEQAITVSELARRTGIGQPVIHRLISGTTIDPKLSTLSAIANYFSVSINQLIGDEPLPKGRDQNFKIPILIWEQLINWPANKAEFTVLPYLRTDALVSKNSYSIIVKDSAMQPLFPEKTLLIVDPLQIPEDGDYIIIYSHKSQRTIFRQLLNDGQQQYIKPLNTAFKMLPLHKKDKILGVVVQTKANYK